MIIHATAENPDIMMLTESWINTRDKHQIPEVSLYGYTVFEKCLTHRNGGGLLLYATNYMKVVKINKINADAYDTLYVRITEKKRNISSSYYTENYTISYNEIKSVIIDKNTVICGDFNNPSVNLSSLTADSEGIRLLELKEEAFLYQIVQTPTRRNNILDLIFTNDSNIIYTCEVSEPLGNSNHNIVRTKLNLHIIKKKKNAIFI